MSPQRIQLSRAKGWRKPAGAVVVSRPSKWGNPFLIRRVQCPSPAGGMCWSVTDGRGLTRDCLDTEVRARQLAVELYELHTGTFCNYELDLDEVRAELAGRDLACWCPLLDTEGNRVPCHADILLKLANLHTSPDSEDN